MVHQLQDCYRNQMEKVFMLAEERGRFSHTKLRAGFMLGY